MVLRGPRESEAQRSLLRPSMTTAARRARAFRGSEGIGFLAHFFLVLKKMWVAAVKPGGVLLTAAPRFKVAAFLAPAACWGVAGRSSRREGLRSFSPG